jgi:dTDP-4-amino-4,6-dideoxygalactose transaminase
MTAAGPRILLIGGNYRALCVLEHLLERGERVVAFVGQEAGEAPDFCADILEICDRSSVAARSGRKFGEEMVRWLEDRIRPELAIAVGVSTEIPLAVGGNCRLGLLDVVDRDPPGAGPVVELRQRGLTAVERRVDAGDGAHPEDVFVGIVDATLAALDEYLDRLTAVGSSQRDRVPLRPRSLPADDLELLARRPRAGDETAALEREVGEYVGAERVFALRSHREALELLAQSLELRDGDEVICAALGSGAAVEGLRRSGARAVFADVREDRLTLDPSRIDELLGPRTRGLLIGHAFGQPAELDVLYQLAEEHQLEVFEDAGESLGARFGESRLGRSPCACAFRLPLGAAGPEPSLLALSGELAERVAPRVGDRALGDGAAALARGLLERWEDRLSARRRNASVYSSELCRYDAFRVPPSPEQALPVFSHYVLRITRFARTSAEDLRKLLGETGVETSRIRGHCPERELVMLPAAEAARAQGLLLPVAEGITPEQLDRVLEAIFDYAIG